MFGKNTNKDLELPHELLKSEKKKNHIKLVITLITTNLFVYFLFSTPNNEKVTSQKCPKATYKSSKNYEIVF